MDNNEQIIDEGFNTSESAGLTSGAKSYLLEIAKWSKFLSIIGFIVIGIMVLVGLFGGAMMGAAMAQSGSPIGGGFFTIMYIGFAILYLMPVLYLFKFSTQAKTALMNNNDLGIESALENLKSHYKFIGIFTIVILSIYALVFLIALFAGGMSALV